MSDGDMVEAVARAIMRVNRDGEPHDFGPGRVPSPYETAMARAALAVIESRVRAEERERIAESLIAKADEERAKDTQWSRKRAVAYATAAAAIRSGSEG